VNLEQRLALGLGLMTLFVALLVVEKGVLMALGLHLMMLQSQHTNRLNIILAWNLRQFSVPVLPTDPSYLSVLEHYCYYFSTELN
jgi:hypothetical protein